MIHGPHRRNYNMRLGRVKDIKDGTCQRKRPKPLNNRTIVGEGLFAEYRQRSPGEGGHTGMKWVTPLGMNVEVDNRWVVPYNFHLLKTFNCHINIEYCATITSIKYLFLYHFKGEDLVTIEAEKLRDEIGIFQARKYISACYASWGVAEMPMTSIKPSVHQLLLHLPDEQTCTYQPNLRSAEESLKRKNFTMLTEYFAANNTYGELVQSLKYEDFLLVLYGTTRENCGLQDRDRLLILKE